MEYGKVGLVTDILINHGILAYPRFPGRWKQELTYPEARVWLAEGHSGGDQTTVGVTLLCPSQYGAEECEQMGVRAMDAIESIRGKCRLKPCSFDGHGGYFTMNLMVEFIPEIRLQIGDYHQSYVTKFQAKKPADSENWEILLEKRMPISVTVPDPIAGPFSIICQSDAYHNCYFTEESRTFENGFLVITWKGTATSRTSL